MTSVLQRSVVGMLAAMLSLQAHGQSCPGQGDCLQPHPTPGCSVGACCSSVCAIDPSCCSASWDADCAELANDLCSICGASGLGSCFIQHPTPKCDDAACCSLVCSLDAFCCSVRWDAGCALMASISCEPDEPGTCGDPDAGGCDVPHGTPACSDQACCEAVCAKDPSCCVQAWDSLCVAFADIACSGQCEPPCPAGAVTESEQCGLPGNDVCIQPVTGNQAQPLPIGSACGWLTYQPDSGSDRIDVDVWALDVPDPDGDGLARVTLGFSCNEGTFAALVPAGSCNIAGAPAFAQVESCIEALGSACVAPGSWWIVCTSGAFPQQQPPTTYPCPGRPYTLRVEVDQVCQDPCGSDGPCLSPHAAPGCSDVACCTATCSVDPFCCEQEWDGGCVSSAVQACGISPPPNDACVGAATLLPGVPTIAQTGPATASSLPLPTGCVPTGTIPGNDVWYTVGPLDRAATVLVSTCSVDTLFDTLLVSYRGSCGSLVVDGCSDSGLCPPQTDAELSIDLQCGETALVRVLGRQGELGQVRVLLSVPGGPPCPGACPADLNRSGQVDGADLGVLLSGWGGTGQADLNVDGTVDGADLGVLLSGWGPCP